MAKKRKSVRSMIDENLKILLQNWGFRVGRKVSAPTFSENPELPVWVLEKITNIEPFRAQAIEDAKLFWSFPLPFGFGMELILPENIEILPFQNWQETVHTFKAEIQYYERMDSLQIEHYSINLERIGRENCEWRIIQIYNETEREQTNIFLEFLKNFRAEKR